MAKFLGTRKHGSFKAVCTAPSINKTPVGSSLVPIPYPVMHDLGNSVGVVKHVRLNGRPAYVLKKSTQPKCKGDNAGTGKGIKSGTVTGEVKPVQGACSVRITGQPVIREMDPCTLNGGNCPGIYTTQPAAAGSLGGANPPVKAETKKESSWWSWSGIAHGLLDVASFVPVVGAVAAVADAALYTAEGNYEEAAFAAAGVIPGGKVASKLAKLARIAMKGRKGVRRLRSARRAVKAAKRARKARGRDGFKVKGKKRKKKDKPSKSCPKNQAAACKGNITSGKPIHYGTGEEILEQTDFEIEGESPFAWTRTYRSGSECEDWGLLGARWATPFTASLSLSRQGIVYHEASGRTLRLPPLAVGGEYDHAIEGFVLRRDGDTRFTLSWRDGSADTFEQGPDGWLPHGFDGANAMRKPQPPERVTRCYLTRSQERDGRGITVERFPEARPGEAVLRLHDDSGLLIEALRDETALDPQSTGANEPSRIGRIEEVRPDGHRVCHVRYRYEAERTGPKPAYTQLPEGHEPFDTLPRRCNLVEQVNILGLSRQYAYRYHLLVRCSNYNGFTHQLSWISLAQLRERWSGSELDVKELAALHPISLYNSYQARGTGSIAEDGNERFRIDYIDEDTSRVTSPDGGVLEFTFDENWLNTEVRRIDPAGGPARSLGRREWDEDANLTAEIDAEGNTTHYAYDPAGNLTAITDALGNTTRISYDTHNLPVTVTDPQGNTLHQTYDDRGNLIESRNPLGHLTRYTYNEQNHLIEIIDAKGGIRTLSYDATGHLATHTDCSGNKSHYAYDEGGWLSMQTDPLGQITRYRHDPLGRLLQITYPDGSGERLEYDPEGNLTAHINANGNVTRYRYSGRGLPLERIDAKGQTLKYRYDCALRLVELINGNGESYTFTYDPESRLASETGFDGKTTNYSYDLAGQLIASECRGVRTEFHRDALGQIQIKLTPESHSRFSYDPVGRLIAARTPQAELQYAYDKAGQLIEERHRYSLDPGKPPQQYRPSAAFKLKHEYDPLGNRIRTWLPNGRVIDTLRYGSGHWHGTRWSGYAVADLEHDSMQRETTRQLGQADDRLRVTRDYDPQSRLIELQLVLGQKNLRQQRFHYDPEGNLTHINDRQRGITRHTYDPLGQLLSTIQPDLRETFAFDPAGNLIDKLEEASASKHEPELETPEAKPTAPLYVRHNRLEHYHNLDYEYDVQGNAVLKRINSLTLPDTRAANETATLKLAYDQENRLVRADKRWSHTTVTAHYVYDAFGRRIAKTVHETHWKKPELKSQALSNTTAKITWFLWDGDNLIQELTSDKTITYLYEPDSFIPLARIESDEGQSHYSPESVHMPPVSGWEMPENPLKCEAHVRLWQQYQTWEAEKSHHALWRARKEQARRNKATDYILFYHCDHLGTPQALYDESGKAAWSARYQAWGKIFHYISRKVEQPLRFQGQYEDEETGLHYNRYRYYDSDAGRYITQDPIGLLGGENLYQYAPNSTGWTDPFGLAPYIIFNKTHRNSQPTPKGRGPNGGRLQSHHGLQEKWSRENLTCHGYDPQLAPTITIETGKGQPHTIISQRQNARRDARVARGRGRWCTTLQQELRNTANDLKSAGFDRATIRNVLEQQYKMLDKLRVPYRRIRI